MRSLVYLSLACGLILALVGPACAAPSFRGYTGLINIPTTDTVCLGSFNAAAFVQAGDTDRTVLAANLGLPLGLEAGASYENPEQGAAELLLNAKFRLMDEGLIRPAVAVGVHDLADRIDFSPYVVISKSFTPPTKAVRNVVNPRLYLGFGTGRFDDKLFGGASVTVAGKFSVMAENDGHDFNAGVRFSPTSSLEVHAAALEGFDSFGVGVSYSKEL